MTEKSFLGELTIKNKLSEHCGLLVKFKQQCRRLFGGFYIFASINDHF